MTDDINLPELPDPYWWDAYTADQVREAQLAAVIADRSQALTKVPDGIDPSHPAFVAGFKMGHTAGQQRGLADRAQRQAVPQGWKLVPVGVRPLEQTPVDVALGVASSSNAAHIGPPDWLRLALECGSYAGNGAHVAFTAEAWANFTASLSAVIAIGVQASPTPPASTEAHPIGNFTLPAIGQPWPGIDGVYAGVSRGEDGEPDGHLVLLNAQPEDDMSWDAAVEWANTKPAGEPVQDAASVEGLMELVSEYGRYKSEQRHGAALEIREDIRAYAQRLKKGK